jgi:hypothetical protein
MATGCPGETTAVVVVGFGWIVVIAIRATSVDCIVVERAAAQHTADDSEQPGRANLTFAYARNKVFFLGPATSRAVAIYCRQNR